MHGPWLETMGVKWGVGSCREGACLVALPELAPLVLFCFFGVPLFSTNQAKQHLIFFWGPLPAQVVSFKMVGLGASLTEPHRKPEDSPEFGIFPQLQLHSLSSMFPCLSDGHSCKYMMMFCWTLSCLWTLYLTNPGMIRFPYVNTKQQGHPTVSKVVQAGFRTHPQDDFQGSTF